MNKETEFCDFVGHHPHPSTTRRLLHQESHPATMRLDYASSWPEGLNFGGTGVPDFNIFIVFEWPGTYSISQRNCHNLGKSWHTENLHGEGDRRYGKNRLFIFSGTAMMFEPADRGTTVLIGGEKIKLNPGIRLDSLLNFTAHINDRLTKAKTADPGITFVTVGITMVLFPLLTIHMLYDVRCG